MTAPWILRVLSCLVVVLLAVFLDLENLAPYTVKSFVENTVAGGIVQELLPPLSNDKNDSLIQKDENKQVNQSASDHHPALTSPQNSTRETPPGPFRTNSLAWLEGTRLSNQPEDEDFIFSQILGLDNVLMQQEPMKLYQSLTDRTLCHVDSNFRKPTLRDWDVLNEAMVREWTFRLAYLAIHSWHHAPAAREAKLRLRYKNRTYHPGTVNYTVSPYDFECPTAKYLITSVPRLGMGASYRMGVVNAVLMGIATGRITILLNSLTSKHSIPEGLHEELWLSSCDRKDMQCSFLPTTPCVVTQENIDFDLVYVPEGVARHIRRRGIILNQTLAEYRYLYTDSRVTPVPDKGVMGKVRGALTHQAKLLVDKVRRSTNGLPQEKFSVLDEALRRLGQGFVQPMDQGLYPYRNRNSAIHHAALLYVLRMQRKLQSRIDAKVKQILSRTPHFDPSLSIGLPIRGSDKCGGESKCLNFSTYMDLSQDIWKERFETIAGAKKGTIVVTTEASDIASSSRLYQSDTLSIVMNTDDTLQNTGRPRNPKYRYQADAIMESSLIALRLQLYAKVTVGNCCSNFHLLLFDLLYGGCGLSLEPPQCLQEAKDPKYHVCCSWTATDECDLQWGRKNATDSTV